MVDASGIVDRQLQRLDSSEGIQLLHVRNSGQERAILAAEEAVDEQLPLTGNAPASDTVLKSTRRFLPSAGLTNWTKWLIGASVIIIATSVLCFLVWLAALPAPAAKFADCSPNADQQPAGWLRPISYSTSFSFSEGNFLGDDSLATHTFVGNTTLHFTALRTLDSIILHSAGLQYSEIRFFQSAGQSTCLCGSLCQIQSCLAIVTNISCPSSELIRVNLGREVVAGTNNTMSMHYAGKFSPGHGIYRSSTFRSAPTGAKETVLLVTQLEQTGARHMFPCVDEPSSKAVFSVDLTYPAGLTALSNAALLARTVLTPDGRQRQWHDPTPTMSPYLLAVCIGRLVSKTKTSAQGLEVSVWSTPGLDRQLIFPLQVAGDALDFFADWTGIPQPLKKFDLVAVPGKGGAMENWGLLLFDEYRFLWNNETEGAYGQWLSADVICHEVAHQWFGNLVTCQNWSHLTINEGLASFMEYQCLQAVFPNVSTAALMRRATSPMGETIGIHEGFRQTALLSDLEPFTAALVTDPDSILQPNGQITYSKGASIMLMLQSFFEAGKAGSFQAGMRAFLQSHLYGTAAVDDLIDSLFGSFTPPGNIQVSKDKLRQLMSLWFYQPGYPRLTLSTTLQDSSLEQSQMLMWGQESQPELWSIPVHLQNINDTPAAKDFWIIKEDKDAVWLIDPDASGLYRVSYPESYVAAFQNLLRSLTSSKPHRIFAAAAVLHNAFAFLQQGSGTFSRVLAIAEAIITSPAINSTLGYYSLAGTLLDGFRMLRQMLILEAECQKDLERLTNQMTAKLVNETLAQLGGKSTEEYYQIPFLLRMAQAELLRDAALSGNDGALDFLSTLFRNSMGNDAIPIIPDLRGAVYAAVSAAPSGWNSSWGSRLVWQHFHDCWQTTIDSAESRMCLFAMANTADAQSRRETAELLLNNSKTAKAITSSEANGALSVLCHSLEGSQAIWQSISNRLPKFDHDSPSAPSSEEVRLWSILDAIPLPPSHTILQELDARMPSKDYPDKSAVFFTQQKVRGRLLHIINVFEGRRIEICDDLKRKLDR